MPIEVTCSDSRCGEGFVCPDGEAGKTVFCPHCKSPVVAPVSEDGGLPAQSLGAYRLVRKIAHGGMGEIYEAVQLKLDRRVALKTLSDDLSGDAGYLKRFKREARAAASVNHPGVVQVYDSGEEDGLHYLVMELIEGRDLSERVKIDGKVAIDEALRIVEEVAEALKAALAHGVIHRDIKPANIMLTNKGQVKVSDLGLAKVMTDDTDLTMTGVGLGSPHFIAPEQADDARRVDHRADIYSLGITTLFLLTGKRPFEGSSAFSVVVAQANKPLPSGKELGTELPPGVEALIVRMTAKQPSRRYADYDVLLADLREVRADPQAVLAPAPAASPEDRTEVLGKPPKATVAPKPAPGISPTAKQAVGAALMAIVVLLVLQIVFSSASSEGGADGATGQQASAAGAASGPDPGDFTTNGLVKLLDRMRAELPDMKVLLPVIERDYEVGLSRLPAVESNPLPAGPPDEMLALADEYAAANPRIYKEILARYDQVRTAASGSSVEAGVEEQLKQWTLRYLNEMDALYLENLREMDYFLRQRNPRAAEELWLQFPEALRSPPVDRLIAEVLATQMPPPRDERGGPGGRRGKGGKGGPRGPGPPRESEFREGPPGEGGPGGDRQPPPPRDGREPDF